MYCHAARHWLSCEKLLGWFHFIHTKRIAELYLRQSDNDKTDGRSSSQSAQEIGSCEEKEGGEWTEARWAGRPVSELSGAAEHQKRWGTKTCMYIALVNLSCSGLRNMLRSQSWDACRLKHFSGNKVADNLLGYTWLLSYLIACRKFRAARWVIRW